MKTPPVRHCFAEVFGTFTLVFAGTGAIVVNASTGGSITHPGVALTFGLVVAAMIYAFGGISGAHLNPAVTLAFYAARTISLRHALTYIAAQIAGASLGSLTVLLTLGSQAHLGATLPSGSPAQAFTLEVILTLILMLVILCVSRGGTTSNPMAGIAIGAVIALEAMFCGPITGASMNPARSLAPALFSGNLTHLWLYLAAPTLGAILAVPIYRLLAEPLSPVPPSATNKPAHSDPVLPEFVESK